MFLHCLRYCPRCPGNRLGFFEHTFLEIDTAMRLNPLDLHQSSGGVVNHLVGEVTFGAEGRGKMVVIIVYRIAGIFRDYKCLCFSLIKYLPGTFIPMNLISHELQCCKKAAIPQKLNPQNSKSEFWPFCESLYPQTI